VASPVARTSSPTRRKRRRCRGRRGRRAACAPCRCRRGCSRAAPPRACPPSAGPPVGRCTAPQSGSPPSGRARVEHCGGELLAEDVGAWKGRLERSEHVHLAAEGARLARIRAPDPRPEGRRQRRHGQDAHARPAANDVGQPADDMAAAFDRHLRPRSRSDRVQPPRLLEDRVRAVFVSRLRARRCLRRSAGGTVEGGDRMTIRTIDGASRQVAGSTRPGPARRRRARRTR
jgi:hypothetical protein